MKEIDVYTCKRCDITSLAEGMCPCPRGECEADYLGTVNIKVEEDIIHTWVEKE